MDTWDGEDFEPSVTPAAAQPDLWAGEDEDDDVKECWEDEEEEKKDEEKVEEKVVLPPAPKSKAKKFAEKLAEKERAEADGIDEFEGVGLTKEEIELRRRKLQEESDLRVAMETFGVTESSPSTGLDAFNPNTKEEFEEFKKALVEKISFFRDNDEFPEFITDLVKNICLHLNATTLRLLKTNVENLCHEKQKLEKADKTKKPNKGKGKAKLLVEKTNMYGYDNDFGNELDDFM